MTLYKKSCPICNTKFTSRKIFAKFCSRICSLFIARTQKPKKAMTTIQCLTCSKNFEVTTSSVVRKKRNNETPSQYCSQHCWQTRPRPVPKERPCTKCNQIKPFTAEYFPTAPTYKTKSRLSRICKPCTSRLSRPSAKVYKEKLKREVLTAYSNGPLGCVCCGENHIEFLSLDHIKGRGHGARHRKEKTQTAIFSELRRTGFPKGEFRTLCLNCNWAYGVSGTCPHQLEKAVTEPPSDGPPV